MLTGATWLNNNPLYATGMELGAQAGEQANRLDYARQHDANELLLNYSQLGANIYAHQKELEAQKARQATEDAYRRDQLALHQNAYDLDLRKFNEKASDEEKRRKDEEGFLGELSPVAPITPGATGTALSAPALAPPLPPEDIPPIETSDAQGNPLLSPDLAAQTAPTTPEPKPMLSTPSVSSLLQKYPRAAESPRVSAWLSAHDKELTDADTAGFLKLTADGTDPGEALKQFPRASKDATIRTMVVQNAIDERRANAIAKDIQPVVKTVEVNGKTIHLIYNPATGASKILDDKEGKKASDLTFKLTGIDGQLKTLMDKKAIADANPRKSKLQLSTTEENHLMRLKSDRDGVMAQLHSLTNAPSGGSSEYKTAEDVRTAVNSGKLSRDEGIKILKEQFGLK